MNDHEDRLLSGLMADCAADLDQLTQPHMGVFVKVKPIYSGTERRRPMKSLKKIDVVQSKDKLEVSTEYLETAAYYLWQSRNCPMNDPSIDWHEAEKQWREHAEGASV
jgi:hypothetical protein